MSPYKCGFNEVDSGSLLAAFGHCLTNRSIPFIHMTVTAERCSILGDSSAIWRLSTRYMSTRAFVISIARTDFGQRITAAEKKLIFSDYQMWYCFNYPMSSVLSGSPRRSSRLQVLQVRQVLRLAYSKEPTGFYERNSLLGRLVETQMIRSFAQVKNEAHVDQKAYDPTVDCKDVDDNTKCKWDLPSKVSRKR